LTAPAGGTPGRRADIAALVLAAGYSRRMGVFKPLLPFGGTTILERVIATVRGAGIETIRVVVGWQSERLVPVLERARVAWVHNPDYAAGMYRSLQAGVRSLPAEAAAFFLLPADMPLVDGRTLVRLAAEWDRRPGGILYPVRGRRRGHPPLLARAYASEILTQSPPGGLRELLARHAEEARHVECGDPGVLADLDTPEDYRRALRAGSPGRRE